MNEDKIDRDVLQFMLNYYRNKCYQLEYEFLLGAKEKILKYKPIIIIEIWNDNKRRNENMDTKQENIIKMIESLNYKLIRNIYDDFIFETF